MPRMWSIRRPPPCRITARTRSRQAAYPVSASASGRHGGCDQSCPCWLNASGGAPTWMPGGQHALQSPGVRAVRVDADREVVHDAERHAGRSSPAPASGRVARPAATAASSGTPPRPGYRCGRQQLPGTPGRAAPPATCSTPARAGPRSRPRWRSRPARGPRGRSTRRTPRSGRSTGGRRRAAAGPPAWRPRRCPGRVRPASSFSARVCRPRVRTRSRSAGARSPYSSMSSIRR